MQLRTPAADPGLSEDGSTINGFETLSMPRASISDITPAATPDFAADVDDFSESSDGIDTKGAATADSTDLVPDAQLLERLTLEPDWQSEPRPQSRAVLNPSCEHSTTSSEGQQVVMSESRIGLAQTSAAVNLDDVVYMLKLIRFQGTERVIVLQSTNGACPIIALANILSLHGSLRLPRDRADVSAADLSAILADYLISENADLALLSQLEGLHRGMNINPKFSACDAFEQSNEVFTALSVQLVHGWVPSTYHVAYDVLVSEDISKTPVAPNYEAAQMHLLLHPDSIKSQRIEVFLHDYPNNMTPTGLEQIRDLQQEGQLHVLFYNSHFHVVYKNPEANSLFTLVTDAGYLASGNDVVWESLVLDKSTELFNADFIPRSVLGESMHDNDYGIQKSDRRTEEDGDAALARKLHEEERGTTDHSDEAMARALQEEEDARVARHMEQEQASSAQSQGHTRTRSAPQSSQRVRPPADTRRTSGSAQQTPVSQRKKSGSKESDCLVM